MAARPATVLTALLLTFALAWLTLVLFSDGAHGPFGIWDATCHGTAPTGDGYSEGAQRVAYSSISLVAAMLALLVSPLARRNAWLGCLGIWLLPVAAVIWFSAQGASHGHCSG